MKHKIILLVLLNVYYQSYSQHTSTFSDPTFGNLQVQDGRVNISYELYNLNNGQIKVPITLSYSGTKGIKVNEIASRVGLGWNLNAGGSISRIIVGYPDDEYKNEDKREGILFNSNLQQIQDLNTLTASKEVIEDIIEKDFEPDIFIINAPTFSARFMFNENNEIINISDPFLKITYQQNTQGKLSSFTVTDENGLTYLFDEISTTTEKTNFEYPSFVISGKEYTERTYNSSWHLSKVSDSWSNSVDFNYNTETIDFSTNKVEKAKIYKNEGNTAYPTVNGYDYTGSTDIIQAQKILSSITTSQGEDISFTDGFPRSDLSGSTNLYVININNGNITYRFITGYIGSGSNLRLILDRVIKNNKLFLKFTYDSEELPPRLSFEQDYWGYYNNNSAGTLIPEIFVDESATNSKSFVDYGYTNFNSNGLITLNGADRRSTLNSEAGILKEISDIRGAKRIFQYELNEFEYNGQQVLGNGLRVKKISEVSGSAIYDRTFTYEKSNGNSSGTVIETPKFSYITPWRGIKYLKGQFLYEELNNTKFRVAFPSYVNEGSANWSSAEKYDITTVRFAFPVNSTFSEYDVFYSRIIEESDFYEGKKVYSFDTPQYIQDFSDAKHRIRPTGSLVNGDPIHENVNSDFGSLPYVPSTISRHNIVSFPKSEEFLNANGNKVYEKVYQYETTPSNQPLHGLKYSTLEGSRPFQGPSSLLSPYMPIWHLFSKYTIIDNQSKTISSESTTEYLSDGDFEFSKTFEYYSDDFIKKETWYDSEENLYEKYYTYPFNYFTISFANPIPIGSDAYLMNKLTELNRLHEPVEIILFKNGQAIAGEIFKYRLDNGFINLAERKVFELVNPNSTAPYVFATINNSNLVIDSRYESENYYDEYDRFGNLLQEHQADGIPISYIYGYNGKYIVAKLENVNYLTISQSLRNSLETTTVEGELISLQNQLRAAFPTGHITTYTYFPHIGKKTETDVRGETLHYEYDDFNRLNRVKDKLGNLLSDYQYHFKNQ